MKKEYLSILILWLVCCTMQAQSIAVVPQPSEIICSSAPVILKNGIEIKVYITPEAELEKAYISDLLQEMNLSPVYVPKNKKARLVLEMKPGVTGNPEGYLLNIDPKEKNPIHIQAETEAGLRYAMQTLRQLVYEQNGATCFPGCKIKDIPTFSWRAFMLDESRHFQGMATVKNLLDEMARLKMNTFHWHLVDDPGWRIEIKKYPLLTKIGSKRDFSHREITPAGWDSIHSERTYYTQDEIREIIQYAAIRGIRIIPEIEVPGHASASIAAYPWLGTSSRKEDKPVWGDLYQVTDPKVEQFLQDVLSEVVALFPSKIVHIGGDEAGFVHWQNDKDITAFMKANNLPTCSDLQLWAINRASAFLASKGCKMIGWNEITGDNIRNEQHVEASKSEQLAAGTIVQFWDGEVSLVNKAIQKGYDVVNSNRLFTYLDYPYDAIPLEKAYSFNPIPENLPANVSNKILGTGCQMWGEFTPTLERLYFQTFPRIAAYAECGWTENSKKDYKDFCNRMQKIQQIWDKKGYINTQLLYK